MSPLLSMNPLVALIIISLAVSVIITVIYKFTTDQNLMKQLKDEMKEFQKEIKELRQHPEKMMAVQKKSMQTNMKYMTQSFKSTFFTFIPIILIFGWMNAHFAYDPILPGEQFQMTLDFKKETIGEVLLVVPRGIEIIGDRTQEITNDKVAFNLKGEEGNYKEGDALIFKFDDKDFYKNIIISNDFKYEKKQEVIDHPNLKSISINYNKKVILPVLNWGWLGTYIIFSIIFSMLLRRVLKVY